MKNSLHLSAWALVALLVGACGGVKHLGEKTGVAYKRAFSRSDQRDSTHKAMEAELARRAAQEMVSNPQSGARSKLTIPLVQTGGGGG